MNLFIELNNLSSKYRFYPKKGSGIHFITDKELIKKIIFFLELKKSDKVLEVNGSEFFVAREIEKKSSLTVLEEKKGLTEMLKKELSKTKLVSSFSEINSNKSFSFVSAADSGESFLELLFFDFELMVLLLQKEFSQKILAEPGFSDYSALTVMTDTFFEVNKIVQVNSDSFFPRTSSDFVLIKFKKKKNKIKNKKDFFEFVKALFRFKNRVFFVALPKALQLMKLDKTTKNKILKNAEKTEFNENNFFRKKFNQTAFLEKRQAAKKQKFNQKIYLLETIDFVELFNLLSK